MAKKTETAVAILNKKSLSQNDVPALLKEVNDQISKLKGDGDAEPRTSGELPGVGNLNNMDNPEALIGAYASIISRENVYNKAVKEMKAKETAFKLGGISGDAWKSDILRRYNEVTFKEKLSQLNQIKDELEKHLSSEDKLNASLGNIRNIILG